MVTATGPSPHLTWRELACKDGTPYPMKWRRSRAAWLADEFERIRAVCGGQPITITSAYRTPAHNRRQGGSPRSQHLEGRALDLQPPAGMTVGQFLRVIEQLATLPECRIRGIGKYRTFVHVDLRPAPTVARWTWTSQLQKGRT